MAFDSYSEQTEDRAEDWYSVSEYEKQASGERFHGSLNSENIPSLRSASEYIDQGDLESDEDYYANDPYNVNNTNSTMDSMFINDRELSVKKLNIDQKRFFITLRENDFGRFIRIVEATKKYSKNKVIIPEGLLKEFLDIIGDFSYQIQDKRVFSDSSYGTFSDILVRKTLKQHSKSIFIELRENKIGKFLKVISLLRHDRQHVIVPAAGISALYSIVETMMQESELIVRQNLFEDDTGNSIETPVGNNNVPHPAPIAKIFIGSHMYFDVKFASSQDISLKITDDVTDTSLQIAHKDWTPCVKALQMLIEKYPLPNT